MQLPQALAVSVLQPRGAIFLSRLLCMVCLALETAAPGGKRRSVASTGNDENYTVALARGIKPSYR